MNENGGFIKRFQAVGAAESRIEDLKARSALWILISGFWVEPVGYSIKLPKIMGAYQGRVHLRRRKRRFLKTQRIKALAAAKQKAELPSPGSQQANVQPKPE